MKQSTDGSVIVTEAGEGLKHPEGVPEENIGQPEFTDWRERAFDLARQLNEANERIAAQQLIIDAHKADRKVMLELLGVRSMVERSAQRSVWLKLLDLLRRVVETVRNRFRSS